MNGQLRIFRRYLFVIDTGGQRESIGSPNDNCRANHYLWCSLAVSVEAISVGVWRLPVK